MPYKYSMILIIDTMLLIIQIYEAPQFPTLKLIFFKWLLIVC